MKKHFSVIICISLLSTPLAFADQSSSPATDSDTNAHVFHLPDLNLEKGRIRLRDDEFSLQLNYLEDSRGTSGAGARVKAKTYLLADVPSSIYRGENYHSWLVFTPGIDASFNSNIDERDIGGGAESKFYLSRADATGLTIHSSRSVQRINDNDNEKIQQFQNINNEAYDKIRGACNTAGLGSEECKSKDEFLNQTGLRRRKCYRCRQSTPAPLTAA